MLIGWAPKNNQEIFSLEEFVKNFQKGSLQIANPVFNRKKLDWFNGEYIRQKSDSELQSLLADFDLCSKNIDENILAKAVPLVKDRITKLSEFSSLAGFLWEKPKIDTSLFGDLSYQEHLNGAILNLSNLSNWTNDEIQASLTSLIEKNNWKTGDFFMTFRIALSGSKFTPPITNCAEILGKEETLLRLKIL
jgi:glutamyl/glutaminyl-tRNA synthetase